MWKYNVLIGIIQFGINIKLLFIRESIPILEHVYLQS